MKPSNSGIPIYLAVFCLLFQNVSSISQQQRLSNRDVEEDNQNFTQQERLSIRDGEEDNFIPTCSVNYIFHNITIMISWKPLTIRREASLDTANDLIYYWPNLVNLGLTNVLEIGELMNSSDFRVGISLLIYVLFVSSAIIRSSISNNPKRLKDPFSTLVDCLKKTPWTSRLSLFLIPLSLIYELVKLEKYTGELEKWRKHFMQSQVMWAVTWILLLTFLFYYVSQIYDDDNGVCSNQVSGMILSLPIKKLVLLLLPIMSTGFASASTYCAENQTAEIDAPGMINCSFPEYFYRVAWFDEVSKHNFDISCEAPCSVKEGPGLQYYDIFQNGSLRIPRVTVQHERYFQVFVYPSQEYFEKQTVYLKVIALPGQRLPTLDCNGIIPYHYHKVNGKTILTCSFNATRPPVQLTWLQRTNEGDISVKQQEKAVFENEDSTFNSSVTIDLITTPLENRMLLFVCKANWTLHGWEKEKDILLDNRDHQPSEGKPNETLYFEQGRQANVRCKGSNGFLQLWEKISSNNGPDMIGFTANGLTRAVATSQDPTISSEGHLIFSSAQVDDEGIYVCAYSHDMRNEVYVVAVTILIAPFPPYIHIKGCKDDNQACSLKAYDRGQLSCFVMGVRPSVSLEWIASDGHNGKIAFHASNQTIKEHGATSDTELSAEYELISENINCGDNVYIKCRLNGPVSHIINRDERTVQLTREPCRHDKDDGDGLSTVEMILISLCFILVVGLCIAVWLICKCHKRNVANGSRGNMAAERFPMNDIENGTWFVLDEQLHGTVMRVFQ